MATSSDEAAVVKSPGDSDSEFELTLDDSGGLVAYFIIILVVLPLISLLIGSVKGEQGMSLDHFSEVLSGRLYVNALKNSLILGAWTGLFSLIIGVSLAWAVSRTDVPGKSLIQLTASLSYLSPPFLTAIAFVYLFSPNAGLINVLVRDVMGLPFLTFNIFSMTGLVVVTVLPVPNDYAKVCTSPASPGGPCTGTQPEVRFTVDAAGNPNGVGAIMVDTAAQNLINHVLRGKGQPHARLPESSHFLQDDQGPEIARRLNEWIKTRN
jgi:hypothetical protein